LREKLKQFQTRLFAELCSAGSRYSHFQKFSLDGWAFLTFFSGNYGAKFSKNCKKGAKIYADGPSGGPDWGLRFVITPLFPTGGKPPARETSYAK
jgi:hypothetical protein